MRLLPGRRASHIPGDKTHDHAPLCPPPVPARLCRAGRCHGAWCPAVDGGRRDDRRASSMSGPRTISATTRPMPKAPPRSRRWRVSPSSRKRTWPKPSTCRSPMESMINFDGATLLFPDVLSATSIPISLPWRRNIPMIRVSNIAAGFGRKACTPANVGSYFGYIGLGQYLNGIVAGHMPRQTKKLGFRRGQAHPAGAAEHQLLPPWARVRSIRRSPVR
jgi:hypothetical protein